MNEIRHIIDEKNGWWVERTVNKCDCFEQTNKGGYIRVKECYDKTICNNK